jgi:hypothetical protein
MYKCSVYLDLRAASEMFEDVRGVLKYYATYLNSLIDTGKWLENVFTIETMSLDDSIIIANRIINSINDKNLTLATRIPIRGCAITTIDDTISYQVMNQAFRLYSSMPTIYISPEKVSKRSVPASSGSGQNHKKGNYEGICRYIENVTGNIVRGFFLSQEQSQTIYAYTYEDENGIMNTLLNHNLPTKLIDKCISGKHTIVLLTLDINIQTSTHESLLSDSIIFRNLATLHSIGKNLNYSLIISPDLEGFMVYNSQKYIKFNHEGQLYFALTSLSGSDQEGNPPVSSPIGNDPRGARGLERKTNVVSNPNTSQHVESTKKKMVRFELPSSSSNDTNTDPNIAILSDLIAAKILNNMNTKMKSIYSPSLPKGLPYIINK